MIGRWLGPLVGLSAMAFASHAHAQDYNDYATAFADYQSSCRAERERFARDDAARIGYENALRQLDDSGGNRSGWIGEVLRAGPT